MKKLLVLLFLFAVFPALPAGRLFPSLISAQSRLTYPIADLGYCRDAKECSLYCEIPENKAACWSYGKYKVGSNVLGVTTMSADEKRMMEEKARQYNITFPIADLGSCAGPQECRDYCEQSANQTTCMDFAKKKGFQKDMERSDGMDTGKRDQLLEKAKTELGCTSMQSCSNICQTDHARCETFAKKHGVYQEPTQSSGRYSADEKMKLMEKAQGELGCSSMESCKSICEKSPERCMEFAKKHGFDKEEHEYQEEQEQYENRQYQKGAPDRDPSKYRIERIDGENMPDRPTRGPSGKPGCDSEASCKQYCQEHPDECAGFQSDARPSVDGAQPSTQQILKQSQNSYVGPSGCRTEAECKNWCNDHPDKCPGFSAGKSREENTKREFEIRKNEMENQQEMQKRTEEYRPPSQNYPGTSTQPVYQNTQPSGETYSQPSSGSYTPPATQPAAP